MTVVGVGWAGCWSGVGIGDGGVGDGVRMEGGDGSGVDGGGVEAVACA